MGSLRRVAEYVLFPVLVFFTLGMLWFTDTDEEDGWG